MMRVLLPNGRILSVRSVVAVEEKMVEFNGTSKYFRQSSNMITDETSGIEFVCRECKFVVSNLRNGEVKKIIKQIVKDGYFDFSGYSLKLISEYDCTNFLGEKYSRYLIWPSYAFDNCFNDVEHDMEKTTLSDLFAENQRDCGFMEVYEDGFEDIYLEEKCDDSVVDEDGYDQEYEFETEDDADEVSGM